MTQSTRDVVRESAERNFAGHQLETIHESGLFRHYRCGSPHRNAYAFWVTTIPGYLFLTGDLGETVLRREADMLPWLARAIDDPHYLAGKVAPEINTKEFDEERAKRWVREFAEECPDELSAEQAEELMGQIEEKGEGAIGDIMCALGDYDPPSCRKLSATFWWHYECLKWFARAAKLKGE